MSRTFAGAAVEMRGALRLDSSKPTPVEDDSRFASVKVAVIAPRDVPSKFEFEQVAIFVGW